jgi:DNA-binding NarL/FixJ family response regulator
MAPALATIDFPPATIDFPPAARTASRQAVQELRLVRPMIRVAVADGEALIRAAFSALLEGPDITVVGEAGDGENAVALARRVRPDVMLVELDLPDVDGLEVTRRILAEPDLDVRVIVLAASDLDEELFDALRAGASAFIVKDTHPAELVDAVHAVADGDALLSSTDTRRLIAALASQPDPELPSPELLEELTTREREVTALVGAGLNNDEIAERLFVSVATAKTHVSRALRKVDARDRAQLAALAYQTGLAQPRTRPAFEDALAC